MPQCNKTTITNLWYDLEKYFFQIIFVKLKFSVSNIKPKWPENLSLFIIIYSKIYKPSINLDHNVS